MALNSIDGPSFVSFLKEKANRNHFKLVVFTSPKTTKALLAKYGNAKLLKSN
jgi:uroporphyrinogen-III synthase